MTILRRLITRVRIYFARRRIWRALRADAERKDYGAMADLNLANWWKRRKP